MEEKSVGLVGEVSGDEVGQIPKPEEPGNDTQDSRLLVNGKYRSIGSRPRPLSRRSSSPDALAGMEVENHQSQRY